MSELPVSNNDIRMRAFSSGSSAGWSAETKGQLLAKKIENRMNERGLTRQEFANLMEVQPSIITRWLSGKHNFTIATLFEIEQKLDFPILNLYESANTLNLRLHLSVHSQKTNLINTKELVGAFNHLKFETDAFQAVNELNKALALKDESFLHPIFYSLDKKESK